MISIYCHSFKSKYIQIHPRHVNIKHYYYLIGLPSLHVLYILLIVYTCVILTHVNINKKKYIIFIPISYLLSSLLFSSLVFSSLLFSSLFSLFSLLYSLFSAFFFVFFSNFYTLRYLLYTHKAKMSVNMILALLMLIVMLTFCMWIWCDVFLWHRIFVSSRFCDASFLCTRYFYYCVFSIVFLKIAEMLGKVL